MLYFDYAATTPMSERALLAYQEAARHYYGNTSSLHDVGSTASELLESCRESLAKLLHVSSAGIYFTSGGSEANALVIHSVVKARKEKGRHLITSAMEHASLRNVFHALEAQGYEVTYVYPDPSGKITSEIVHDAIREDTILASIQHVNSEIGTIHDLADIGHLLVKHDIFFHSDCVQSFGKLPLNLRRLPVDSITISSHKIYGPKGIGACYINPRQRWLPTIAGTLHENGFRPGTVDVPSIAAFLTAAEEMHERLDQEIIRVMRLRKMFIEELKRNVPRIIIEGTSGNQLPHICGFRLPSIEGQLMMLECNKRGAAISTGSACSVGKMSPSAVMLALGRNKRQAKEFVRISFGIQTTEERMMRLVTILGEIADSFQPKKDDFKVT